MRFQPILNTIFSNISGEHAPGPPTSPKKLNEFVENGEGTDIIKLSSQLISQQVITLSDFYSARENKYHVMKTSSV